jgi:multiple antibiotic resistance protein
VSIVTSALVLFFVMDPLGNIPVFASILGHVAPARRRRVLVRELLVALGCLVLFLLAGKLLLSALGLRPDAIRVGGGIVLFLIAIRLIFPGEGGVFGETLEGEPFVFPMAVPLIAGPSSFATVLLLAEPVHGGLAPGLAAIGIAWSASAVILAGSSGLLRIMGQRGLLAVERLTGMLLVMLAVQMTLEGVDGFFRT